MERRAGRFQHTGHCFCSSLYSTLAVHVRRRLHGLLQRRTRYPARCHLVLPVRALQAPGAGRHRLHRPAQEPAPFPPLVPSRDRASVHPLWDERPQRRGLHLQRDELLRPLSDVLLLRCSCHGLPYPSLDCPVHHIAAALADVCGCLHHCPSLLQLSEWACPRVYCQGRPLLHGDSYVLYLRCSLP